MQLHPNAKTTPRTRRELVRRLEQGQSIQQVARSYGLSRATVRKWQWRWIAEGPRGLLDRRAAPHRIPHRTPKAVERRILQLRRRRWVAWQIARALRMAISTVSAVLRRIGLHRLANLNPPQPPANRYERNRPGELLHVDTKKLGRIRGIGHRMTGRRQHRNRGIGWEFAHVCVDDYTRLSYVEILPDETKESCAAFLRRAVAWLRQHQVVAERVMTDNGSGYLSNLWKGECADLGLRHIRTRPYTPKTNGKAERFIQTLLRQWAYQVPFRSSRQRRDDLARWIRYYNHERPHRALGMNPPSQRLRLSLEQPT